MRTAYGWVVLIAICGLPATGCDKKKEEKKTPPKSDTAAKERCTKCEADVDAKDVCAKCKNCLSKNHCTCGAEPEAAKCAKCAKELASADKCAKCGRHKKDCCGCEKPRPEGGFPVDTWMAWDSFQEGSKVEFVIRSSGEAGGARYDTEMIQTKEIAAKTPEVVTLKTGGKTVKPAKSDLPEGKEEVKKGGVGNGKCAACGKEHKKGSSTRGQGTLIVAQKRLKCVKISTVSYDCKDNEIKAETYYSREVPGWLVKYESSGPHPNKTFQMVKSFEVK